MGKTFRRAAAQRQPDNRLGLAFGEGGVFFEVCGGAEVLGQALKDKTAAADTADSSRRRRVRFITDSLSVWFFQAALRAFRQPESGKNGSIRRQL